MVGKGTLVMGNLKGLNIIALTCQSIISVHVQLDKFLRDWAFTGSWQWNLNFSLVFWYHCLIHIMVVNFTESFLASNNYQYYLRHAKAYGIEKSVVGQ